MTPFRSFALVAALLSLGVVANLLGCVCGPGDLYAYGTQTLDSANTELTLMVTPHADVADIADELSIVLDVVGAPPGSELRVEVAPGTELIGTGPDLRLEMRDFGTLLAGCDGTCEFPVRITLTETPAPSTLVFELRPGTSFSDCGDRVLEVRLP